MKKSRILLCVVLMGVLLVMGSTLRAANTTLDASGDAEVDSHFERRDVALSESTIAGANTELRIENYDPSLYPEDPDISSSHALIKWDVSSIAANQMVTDVTLELSSWYAFYGQVAVYGIAVGDWDETTVTWNSWEATTQSLVFLGNLNPAGNVETYGRTTFTDPDLTAWVQSWVNGTQANYGLILKMPDGAGYYGTSFSSREDTYGPLYYDPQLKITHELATSMVTGTVAIEGYVGDLSLAGVQIELRQGGTPVKTEYILLDASGNFSVPGVELGTYDIAVKVCSQLQKVVAGVSLLNTDPVSIGTVTLQGGDLNGDGLVNSDDIEILAASWLSIGDM